MPGLAIVVLGFALLFLALLPPTNFSSDGESMLAMSNSLASSGSLEIPCAAGVPFEEGRDGNCYSTFYPLLPALGAPLYLIGKTAASAANVSQEYAGEALALVIPALAAAGAAALTMLLALKFGARRRAAILVAVAFAFCTEAIVYARSFFAETLAAFFVALAVWGLTEPGRRRYVGLAAVVLAMLAKPQMVLVGPAVGLALALSRRHARPLVECLVATAVGTLLYGLYNWARFAEVANFGGETRDVETSAYSPAELLESLGLLMISPGRGFLIYSPLVIVGFVILWKRRRDELALACLLVFAGLLVVYLGNPGTGSNWGSRYFVPALPLLCAAAAAARGTLAKVAVALAVLGFVIQLPTIVVDYHRYYAEQQEQGHKSHTRYWSVADGPLLGVWPATARQLEDARNSDVDDLVAGEKSGAELGEGVKGQPPLQVVSLWWWVLPAANVPAALGAGLCLLMLGLGALLLFRAWRPARPPG